MASYIQKAKEESLPLQFTELDADRKQHDMLIPLIKLDTNKGSLYYTDDHTAYYATLSNWKTPDNCSWNGRRIHT
ncbi:MAG: hypothetical protein WBY71_11370 [Nitrososphaeraceae archaeon]|jgi:hypothetical protein